MHRLTIWIPSLLLLFPLGCVDSKPTDKGVVDDSAPPESPPDSGDTALGKADDLSKVIAIDVESAHPYANNMNEEFVIDLSSVVPGCASHVRLHFAALQLESGYDFIRIVDSFGRIVESGTGNHDDEYSEWLELDQDQPVVSVVLETDYSVVRHGFRIDAVEWRGAPICPAFVPTCPDGEVDINPAPKDCECPRVPTCVSAGAIAASHAVGGGFAGTVSGHRLEGTTAIAFTESVTAPGSETVLGTIDRDALFGFIRAAANAGVLHGPSLSEPANWNESLTLTAGPISSSYVAEAGTFARSIATVAAHFDSLMVCGSGGALTCGPGMTCRDRTCVADSGCICPEVIDPVCGSDNVTYDNACLAECRGAAVRHDGACGIEGDICGGFAGFVCQPGGKCRYGEGQFEPPFADAAGTCVAETYCDAAPDCAGLFHIAVPGSWACDNNQCSWQTGSPWLSIGGWSMETAHPYGNNESVWQQLYAPEGAGSVRLELASFSLESGYDFLEIWSWNGREWFRAGRLTGDEPAGATYEFGGRYHYLHFVSDVSVTAPGFEITASYSFDAI